MGIQKSKRRNEKTIFGRFVDERLFIIGKKQKWLAFECGVSEEYISQVLNGKSRPSANLTEKMAQVLEVDVIELRQLVLRAS